MRTPLTVKVAAFASLALCTACGDTAVEQALMGGGAGGAASLLLDGNVATGVVVGAAANVAYCQKYPTRC